MSDANLRAIKEVLKIHFKGQLTVGLPLLKAPLGGTPTLQKLGQCSHLTTPASRIAATCRFHAPGVGQQHHFCAVPQCRGDNQGFDCEVLVPSAGFSLNPPCWFAGFRVSGLVPVPHSWTSALMFAVGVSFIETLADQQWWSATTCSTRLGIRPAN